MDSRMDHLEALFKRYPDVPHEVIFKEDMLREGYYFTPNAIDFCHGEKRKTYQLFSWDFSKVEEMGIEDISVLLPDIIEIIGGMYELRRIRTRPRIRMGSPYSIDLVEEKLWVCD